MKNKGVDVTTLESDKLPKDVPYYVYEAGEARHERTVKRFITAMAVMAIVFLGVLSWREYSWQKLFDSYDISSETITIENEDDGNSNYLEAGMDGVINNGK